MQQEPIAIIGMGCRFPGAKNLQEFWTLLHAGKDAIQEVPANRWDIQRLYDPDSGVPGKMSSRWGGFLDQVDQFDWRAFRMHPREATSMDPQHRLLLEVAWEALEDAGLPFEEVAGSRTNVSIGVGWNDYLRLQARNWSQLDEYTAVGNTNSFAANRLSYAFDFKGPSVSVESGCTSSLTALYLACQSLWAGEACLALAGGVSLTLSPDSMIMLSKAGLISPSGRCKTFDARADGFARGEGAGLVVLKPLSQVRGSDRVYALLRGIAVNHNGHNEWIFASSQTAQEALLQDAYRQAGVNPAFVDYVELHGTGFQRGDSIEAKALGTVLGSCPERTHPCFIGSVKTNIGHLDAASGIASVIKVALSLSHQYIPPTLNIETLNPDIPLDDLHLAVPQMGVPWPEKAVGGQAQGTASAVAGVTTLAFNGTNAHAVLTAYQGQVDEEQLQYEKGAERVYRLLPISARSKEVLDTMAVAYRDFLAMQTAQTAVFRDICYSASVRRTHHSYRLAVLGRTAQEAAEELDRYLQEQGRDNPPNAVQRVGTGLAPVRCEPIAPVFAGSLRTGAIHGCPLTRLEALKALYMEGAKVDWSELFQGKECHCVSLPTYAWQSERLWPDWLDVEEISTPPEGRSAAPRRRDSALRLSGSGKIEITGREVVDVLTDLWADVLGLEKVNASESFFALGGHSLQAQRLVTYIREMFQVELALKDLFGAPKPSDCASLIRQRTGLAPVPDPANTGAIGSQRTGTSPVPTRSSAISSSHSAITPDPKHRYEPFPTTDVQQAYWVGRYADEGGNVGNHGYIEVEATDLDFERFDLALQRLIERHDMLRAVILPDGQQQILAQVQPFALKIVDLRGQEREAQVSQLEQMRQILDHQVLPVEQWPAFAMWISLLDDQRVRLHLSIESIFVDAWSMNTLIHEFIRLYYEPDLSLPKLSLSFRDYVLAEASLRNSAAYQRAQEYWLERLSVLPPAPELPLAPETERTWKRPHFVHREGRLTSVDWQKLKDYAAKIGVTPSGVLLTAFADVLVRWSKTARFSLNLSTFNRLPLHKEVSEIVGDFTSLLVLAIDHTTPASFEEHAKCIQEQLWQDLDHSSYSGIQVLRELVKMQGEGMKAVMPIVFTSLLIQDTAHPLPPPWGKTLYCVSQTPQVWLDHQVLETGGELVFHWQSVDAMFPAGLIDDMFTAYCQLLQRLANVGTCWSEAVRELLPEQQRALLAQVNATEAPVSDKLLHTFFLEQVTQRPDQLALVSPTRLLTYKQMYSGALQLAHQLRDWGARPNQLVGIVMEKGWEQVVAVLGVLLSGAAYLPVDPKLPKARLHFMLEHGEVDVVLTQSWLNEQILWPKNVKPLCVDRLDLSAERFPALDALQGPDDLAYVIYTSGSTGIPKGVMISHRGAVNTILDINQRFSISSTDRMLALSALSFDLSVYDIFGLLAAGGTVVMPTEDDLRNPAVWLDMLVQERVTLWNTVPTFLLMLVEYAEAHPEVQRHSCLRLVLLSGDWIPVTLPDRLRALMEDATIEPVPLEIISLGGATEASIWSILYPIYAVNPAWKSIPYGKPMCNQRLFVLNEVFEPCPVWVAGHLYIGGTGLAKGYWYDSDKTRASFILHPRTGERLYRTGDWGRYLPDGNIEFLGREDFQVKISGHRIELGEIEQTLLQHPAVQAAVVTVITEQESEKRLAPASWQRLVAYVVLRSEYVSHEKRTSYQIQHLRLSQASRRQERDKLVVDLTYESNCTSATKSTPVVQGTGHHPVGSHWWTQGTGQRPALSVPMDLLRKYRRRLSYRHFLPEPLSLKQLSDFLRPLSQIELEDLPKYLYPSAGSIYPVQTYLSVKSGRVEGLLEGVYYYNPELHQLIKLSEGACVERSIHATINQPIFDQSAFSLFLIGDLTSISLQYGEKARDFCLLEAGYMGQLLMMTAAEQHIGLCPIGDSDFGQIRDRFALRENHVLLHSFLCGRVDPNVATGWSFLPTEPEKPTNPPPAIPTTLRHFLQEKLPAYMLPSAILVLDSLPLNQNGKVDRKDLPKPESQSCRKETGYREPTSEIERIVAAVWQEMLGLAKVSIYDNFFAMGGNSLIGLRMINRLQKIFEVDLPFHVLFAMPTVEDMAEVIRQKWAELLGDEGLAEILNNVSQISEEDAILLLEQNFSGQEREG